CNGQRKSAPGHSTDVNQAVPEVIKSFKSVAMIPDKDTMLVSQYIRSIFQDSKGSLWFGTIQEGVVRYDGKTLTYFSDQEGMKSQSVFAINEDKSGNIWIGTDQGVYKYNGRIFQHYGEGEGLMHTDISRKGILVDRSGVVWVGTHGGIYKYDPSAEYSGGKPFSVATTFGSLKMNNAGIIEDDRGTIWFASSDKGVFRFDGKQLSNFQHKPLLGENYAGGMAQDKFGNMWFTMKDGICKFDGKTFTEYTARDGLGGTEFWGILIERSGIIWVTARGSTTRIDPSLINTGKRAFTVFTSSDGFTCCVQSMYEDRSGGVWWGTGQGLYRFDGKRFYQVRKDGPW
ncbi:MAG: two-component regulator propeller domain-containing protein, partial [Bacteroidota bacterium]